MAFPRADGPSPSQGLIWFWVPASLVVMNDIAAYVFGMLFGRTQLIKLSPKKTVEGFVGAIFATVVFAYLVSPRFAPIFRSRDRHPDPCPRVHSESGRRSS